MLATPCYPIPSSSLLNRDEEALLLPSKQLFEFKLTKEELQSLTTDIPILDLTEGMAEDEQNYELDFDWEQLDVHDKTSYDHADDCVDMLDSALATISWEGRMIECRRSDCCNDDDMSTLSVEDAFPTTSHHQDVEQDRQEMAEPVTPPQKIRHHSIMSLPSTPEARLEQLVSNASRRFRGQSLLSMNGIEGYWEDEDEEEVYEDFTQDRRMNHDPSNRVFTANFQLTVL